MFFWKTVDFILKISENVGHSSPYTPKGDIKYYKAIDFS